MRISNFLEPWRVVLGLLPSLLSLANKWLRILPIVEPLEYWALGISLAAAFLSLAIVLVRYARPRLDAARCASARRHAIRWLAIAVLVLGAYLGLVFLYTGGGLAAIVFAIVLYGGVFASFTLGTTCLGIAVSTDCRGV